MLLHIRNIPPQVADALNQDAWKQQRSIQDVLLDLLAEQFQMHRDPTGQPYRYKDGTISIRPSDRMHRKLKIQAAQRGMSMRDRVLQIIEEHYQL